MKNTKRLLAVLLVVAMVLTCLPMTIFAAEKSEATREPAAAQKAQLGFKSTSFRASNSYRYADDESVRAIIVMEGEPAGAATGSRAVVRTKLAAQHNALRKSMSGLKYTELFEYDSLLNGLAVETTYGNLDAISAMEGVKAVYIANHYDLPVYDVKMESSNEMTGLALAHEFGFLGSGTVIAILDTGMTAGHEAFAVYDGMLQSAAISKDAADAFIADKGYGAYVSQKIPFSYDYADIDDNAEDSTNGHGPHVSGIAAGYAEAEDGAITFVGSAPDAQLLEMKIFMDDEPGTDSTIYFAALEDAFELGADVINMSIGAQNGFTYDPELENEVYGNMYEILDKAGVVCSISAGNEYSMAYMASNWAGDGYVTADYADYGTIGSPSTYDGNMSIASLENAAFPANILKVGDLEVAYYDSDEGSQFFNAMVGKEFNYVDCGFGYVEDFENVDVKGKIALISRGDITFQEKVDNAAAAGAAAAIIYNNDVGVIYMSIDPYAIPAASITQEDGLALLAALEGGETKGIKVGREIRATSKPAKRDDTEYIYGYYAELPEDGDPVVLYSAKDGVIMAYSAESEDDGTYITAWNQNTEAVTVSGNKLTADWADAGILYALDMGDGTWAFVDEYEYDYNDSMYCLYNDGTYVGTIGDPDYDGDYLYYELVKSGDGWLFQNCGSGLYLMIEDGMFYDTADASKATVLSFYVISDEDPEDPPIDPPVGEGRAFEWTFEVSEGEFVLVNAASDMAMSNDVITGSNGKNYRAGEKVNPVSGIVTTDNEDLVWTLEATDGGYYIKNAAGETLSCSTGGLDFGDTDNVWAIEANDDGTFYISSTTAKGTSGDPKSIEWYDQYSEFSVYYINDSNGDLFAFDLYKASDEPIVPPEPPVDPDAPVMTFPEEKAIVTNAEGWLMSDYSCWGVTPSLTLKPTITGVGGDVNSVLNNSTDGYTIYSGTSMAAPNVSGFMAVLLSYLMEDEGLTKVERAAKAEAIAESTAWVLEDADGYIYSPRKQGSGLIDIVNAISTYAYITEPIQNLYDNVDGEWEFTFTVKNDAPYAIDYTVTPLAMYDYADYADWSEEGDGSDIRWYNTLTADYLTEDDAIIDCPETVTVPAGGTADVTVKITLTAETKEYFDEIFPNGNFIEGYVFLTPEDEYESEIHATYMGFYGDWTKAPVMEQYDWRDVVELETWLQTTPADDEGNTYYDYGYTYFDFADFEVNTDINLAYVLNYMYLEYYGQLMGGYAGDNLFAYADSFNEKHIAISEGPDGICDTLYMMPMNLRNCRHMIMVVSNAETGEVYYVDDTEYLPKAIYDVDYGYWMNTGTFMWDGTDADGNVLPSDTVVDVNYYCNLAYGEDALYTGAARDENGMVIPEDFVKYANMKADASDYLEWNFQCTVDNDAPEFSYEYDEATQTLTVTATDNQYIAVIDLYEGDELIDEAVFSEDEAGKTCTAVFENIPSDTMYELDVADYASNIVAEDVILGDVETATVKFVFPEGFELDAESNEVVVPVGSTIAMPYLYGEVDGAYFAAWIQTALEAPITGEELDSDEYAWIWDEMYFDEDEFVVEGDVTFYALMERPADIADPHDELALSLYDLTDWSGVWAFNGYDWTAADDASSDYFMTSDLGAFYLDFDNEDEWIEYGYFGDGYLYGAPDDQLFTIETIGVDDYGYTINTIQNADGKYLAITPDGELTLVDEASDDYALWNIWLDGDLYINVVWNCGDDYVLLFNEETGEFGAVYAEDAIVDEPYNLYMFGPSASGYEYFTADEEKPTENCPCWDYTDVDRAAWYHSAVDYVIENGYMGSTSTTALNFEPNAKVTRAMVASILYRINGSPDVEYTGKFTDVKEGSWYTKAIEWCAQNGLASGYTDGTFKPNGNVSRQELAVFMYKLAEYLGRDVSGRADLSGFADAASVPAWSKDYLAWAVSAGIISGQANGGKNYLKPVDGAKRSEFASILMRFLEK